MIKMPKKSARERTMFRWRIRKNIPTEHDKIRLKEKIDLQKKSKEDKEK